jgi:hypothetical protein
MKLQFSIKSSSRRCKSCLRRVRRQPFLTPTYMMDKGAVKGAEQLAIDEKLAIPAGATSTLCRS